MLKIRGRRVNLLLLDRGRSRRILFHKDFKDKVATTKAKAKTDHLQVVDLSRLTISLSGTIRIGVKVSLLFNSWNALSCMSFYSNLTSFWVNLVIGAASQEKSSMNLL